MRVSPLNLATRPVRNDRLPALLFLLAAFALLLVTVQHGVIVYRLRPGGSRALHEEVGRLREESKKLTQEASELRGVKIEKNDRAEWATLKALVDRRTFWWSKLLELLEDMLPRDVRIVSVTPRMQERQRYLDFVVHVQDHEAGFRFEQALRKRPEFGDVVIKSVDGDGSEVEFQITMRYLPGDSKQIAPAAPTPARIAQRDEAR
jgi:Tfp pilus assembly protein PilN